jgi:hypothetical protein
MLANAIARHVVFERSSAQPAQCTAPIGATGELCEAGDRKAEVGSARPRIKRKEGIRSAMRSEIAAHAESRACVFVQVLKCNAGLDSRPAGKLRRGRRRIGVAARCGEQGWRVRRIDQGSLYA